MHPDGIRIGMPFDDSVTSDAFAAVYHPSTGTHLPNPDPSESLCKIESRMVLSGGDEH